VKGIGWGIILSLIWVALRIMLFCFILGDKTISFNIGTFSWTATLLGGLFEEIVFRGLILQQLMEEMTFWKANMLNAIIFLIYHIPTWSVSGFSNLILNCMFIIFIGLIWGYVFKKTKSIWASTIFHTLHNLSVLIGIR
jgi:membrane protease YdiL (CAAX protease family)